MTSAEYCVLLFKNASQKGLLMHTKRCSKCKQVKPLSEFGPEKRSADNYRYSCRTCDRERSRQYRAANREWRNLKAAQRRREHPEKDVEYQRRYRHRFVWRTLLLHARKRAARFGWAYDLDDHLPEIQKRVAAMKCEMTGVDLVNGSGCGGPGKRYFNTISLDRKDPAKGYVYSNIRIVCWAMNCAMGTWGEDVLKMVVQEWMKGRS